MESLLKTVFFILGGTVVLALIILFLPVLILLYVLMPKRSTQTWFNAFNQQYNKRKTQQNQSQNTESDNYCRVPASEDIIDVSADEIKN